MAITTADHAGFTVADLDHSIAWYSQVLGSEPLMRKRSTDEYMGLMIGYPGCDIEYAYFKLPGTPTMLELISYTAPASAKVDTETSNLGNGHLCLLVDDLHAEFERLSAIVEFRSESPVEITAGANQGGWGVYFRDPDGITVQMLQPPAERNFDDGD
jgi:catechol 2,3-dioxygenase-like lactoylglutathione lyase family enzyme